MKDKIYLILGIAMIFFIVGFRSYYYVKMENIISDRDYNTKTNIEKMLYDELEEKINIVKMEGINIFDSEFQNAVVSGDREKIFSLLLSLKNQYEYAENIRVVLKNGQSYSSTNVRDNSKGATSEEWYLKTIRQNKICLSGTENDDGSYSCIVSYPIIVDNTIYGAYGFTIDREMFKSLISKFLFKAKQIYLYDDSGLILYKHVNQIKESDKDEVSVRATENKNSRNNLKFTMEARYNYIDKFVILEILKIVFSIVYVLFIVYGINLIMKSSSKKVIIKIAVMTFTVLLIEWGIDLSYMVIKYDKYINEHTVFIESYKEDAINNMETYCDLTYNNMKDNGLIELIRNNVNYTSNSNDNKKLIESYQNVKNECDYLMNAFYIDTRGKYNSYPESSNLIIKDNNFKNFRTILNNGKMKENIAKNEYDNSVIFTKFYKITEANGELIGVAGINLKYDKFCTKINKAVNEGDQRKIFKVLNNGDFYSQYYDMMFENIPGKTYKGILNLRFYESKINTILTKSAGYFKESKKLHAKRYIYFRDYVDDIYAIEVSIEKKEITDNVTLESVLVVFGAIAIGLIVAGLLSSGTQKYLDPEKEIRLSITKKYNKNAFIEKENDPVLNERMKIFDKDDVFNKKTNLFVNIKENKK